MEAPPDAAIVGHPQGDEVSQRAGQQPKAADVDRPRQQRVRGNIVKQQNGGRHVTDHLRETNRRQP